MNWVGELYRALLHLAFPHSCAGCGADLHEVQQLLCIRCGAQLPHTGFHLHCDNAVERIFWGRLPVHAATAAFYFTKRSVVQQLMHRFKYHGDRDVGLFLGRQMGRLLAASERFAEIDLLVPLPLFADKEKKRGFNQAAVLCAGMAETWNKPVMEQIVARRAHTESQTRKSRTERWQNMEDMFVLLDAAAAEGKHLLLVDDVITTGATLEACGRSLLQAKDARLSIAALCCAGRN